MTALAVSCSILFFVGLALLATAMSLSFPVGRFHMNAPFDRADGFFDLPPGVTVDFGDDAPLTPDQEARIREIVREELATIAKADLATPYFPISLSPTFLSQRGQSDD